MAESPGGVPTLSTAPGMSYLFGALLEGSRNELSLLSAPIGQYIHNGTVVHT